MHRFPAAAVPVIVALAAITGTLAPTAGASPAHVAAPPGSVGVRLLDVPVATANDPRARQYIVDNLAPGATEHRRIEVSNTTGGPLRVAVYADAASITRGAFVGAIGHSTNDLAAWTTLSQGILDVPAGAVVRDTVTIAVPADAAPGERYAVVWAEVSSPSGGNITLVNRAGVRLYVSVGGNNPPASSFTVDTVTAQREANDRPVVLAQVHNTGGRAVDLSGTLALSAVSGSLAAGPYQARLGTTLAPGQSEPVTIVVTDPLADGPWNATVDLRSGLLDEIGQARITFPHRPGNAPPVAAHPPAGNGHQGIPVAAILIGSVLVAILVGLAVLFVAARRRSADRR